MDEQNLDEIRADETSTVHNYSWNGRESKINWEHSRLNVVYMPPDQENEEKAAAHEKARIDLGLPARTEKARERQVVHFVPLECFTLGNAYKVYAETYLTGRSLTDLFYYTKDDEGNKRRVPCIYFEVKTRLGWDCEVPDQMVRVRDEWEKARSENRLGEAGIHPAILEPELIYNEHKNLLKLALEKRDYKKAMEKIGYPGRSIDPTNKKIQRLEALLREATEIICGLDK